MKTVTSHVGRRRPSQPRTRPCPHLRADLRTLLAGVSFTCVVWLLSPAAHAQTSTPVYGDDTTIAAALSPTLRVGESLPQSSGEPTYNTNGQFRFGSQGQFMTTYGYAYDPKPVDISQGFVARLDVFNNGGNGVAFVIKNPTASSYFETPAAPAAGTIGGLGAYGLPSSLGVAFIAYAQSTSNSNDRHFKEVEVFADDANGNATILSDVQGLDLDTGNLTGGNILQVRYLPKFQDLDVYVGTRLVARVAGVDLGSLGVAPGGQAELGVTGGVPAQNLSANIDFFPAYLNHFSIGNNLVFGAGLGPNFYEDRFPFQTLRQSVWNSPDTVKFQKSLEAKGTWDKQASKVGVDGFFTIQPGAFAKNYDFGLSLEMDATGGTADISYPVYLNMSLPAQYSADPGQSFAVPILFYPDPAATIATTSPGANVTSDLIYGGEFGFSLNTSVFGSSISSGNVLDLNIPKKDIKIFDLNEILGSGLIPNVNGGVNYAGYFQGTEGATGTKNTTEHGTKGEGSTEGAKDGTSIASYVQVGITYPPDLSTSGSVPLGSATAANLTSSADSPLVTLSSDFTNDILGEIPGLDILPQIPFFNNDYSLNLAGYPVELGFHIADLYGSVDLGAHVDYNFTPQPQVWLLLSDPNDSTKTATLGPFAFNTATNTVVNPPTVNLPANGDPLTITPVLTLSSSAYPDGQPGFKTSSGNTFKTNGQLKIGGSLSFNPFEFSYQFGDNSFNSSTALGLPFPYTLAGSVPVVTYPLDPFEIGTQSGGTANAVPFQRTIKGKSFTLFPKASDNPVLDALSPASALVQPVGASGSLPLTLTCEHAYLSGQVIWDFNGDPTLPQPAVLAYNRQSASLVTSAIPNSLLSSIGLHTVTIINQDGTGASYPSNSVSFVVNAPAPKLYSLKTQTSNGQLYKVVAGAGGFVLLVSGENFLPPHAGTGGALDYVGSVIQWNGQPLPTTYQDHATLTAIVPSNLVQTTNIAQITVATAGPGGGTSESLSLTPVNPQPVLTSLSQSGSQPGSSGLTLDLYGSGFVTGSTVLWNDGKTNATKTPTYQSPGHLTLALSASDLSTPGARTVQVQNPTPGGGPSAVQTFTVGQYPAGGGIILVPSLTRTPNGIRLQLTVVNTSQTADATSTIIQSATAQAAGKAAVSPVLPNPAQAMLVGTVPAGQSVTPGQIYVFPSGLGTPGQAVLLTVSGSSSGRSFTSRLRAVVP